MTGIIYLVRADWMNDAKHLSYQRQSRNQKQLDPGSSRCRQHAAAHAAQRIFEKTWVAVLDKPYFLDSGKGFIWTSERSGRKHLYLYDLEGKMLHPISQGEWGIDSLLAVDEKAGLAYVASNRDAVPDKQVYALALDGSQAGQPTRITQADGWHDIQFSQTGQYLHRYLVQSRHARRKSACVMQTAAC